MHLPDSSHDGAVQINLYLKGALHGHSQRRWWVDHSPLLLNSLSTHNLCCYYTVKAPQIFCRGKFEGHCVIATQVMSLEFNSGGELSTHYRLCGWPYNAFFQCVFPYVFFHFNNPTYFGYSFFLFLLQFYENIILRVFCPVQLRRQMMACEKWLPVIYSKMRQYLFLLHWIYFVHVRILSNTWYIFNKILTQSGSPFVIQSAF